MERYSEYKVGDIVETLRAWGRRCVWRVVDGMEALGSWLASRGCSEASFWHRISKSNSLSFAKEALLRDPKVPVKRRIHVFCALCAISVLHGAGAWAYTQSMVQALRI